MFLLKDFIAAVAFQMSLEEGIAKLTLRISSKKNHFFSGFIISMIEAPSATPHTYTWMPEPMDQSKQMSVD